MVVLEGGSPRGCSHEGADRRRNVHKQVAHQEENSQNGSDQIQIGNHDRTE